MCNLSLIDLIKVDYSEIYILKLKLFEQFYHGLNMFVIRTLKLVGCFICLYCFHTSVLLRLLSTQACF